MRLAVLAALLLGVASAAAQEAAAPPPDFVAREAAMPAEKAADAEAADPGEADAMRMLKAAQKAKLMGTILYGTPETSYTIVVGAAGRPLDTGAGVWRWASVTKQVLAVIALQEVEAGRLSLDLGIAPYLSDVHLPNADQITVRQLLQHRSGLANPEDGPKDAAGRPLRYLASEPAPAPGPLPECFETPKRAPGEAFEYNNCDYQVLGLILEKVTGQSLDELIRLRVTGPLGMTGTRYLKPGERLSTPVGPQTKYVDDGLDASRYGAAGAMVGPARDLYYFDRGLLGGRLLKPESLAELWKPDPVLGNVALGAWVYEAPLAGCGKPVRLVERRGAIGDIAVHNFIAPDLQRFVIAFGLKDPGFGEPWEGRGVSHDLLSAALCAPR